MNPTALLKAVHLPEYIAFGAQHLDEKLMPKSLDILMNSKLVNGRFTIEQVMVCLNTISVISDFSSKEGMRTRVLFVILMRLMINQGMQKYLKYLSPSARRLAMITTRTIPLRNVAVANLAAIG